MATNAEDDFAAFNTNQRDWTVVSEADVNAVLNDPELAKQSRPFTELTTFWVQLNIANPPLDNVLVRRALAKGIDRSALVRDLAGGVSIPTTSVLPPGMPGSEVGLGHELSFDPAGGRALLAQAGLGDGAERTLTFSVPSAPGDLRRAEYLRSQWSDNLGLDVQLSPMDPADYQLAIDDRQYNLAFGGWSADYPDPQDWFRAVFGCKGAFNTTSYCNSSFDQLVARADAGTGLADRLRLYSLARLLL